MSKLAALKVRHVITDGTYASDFAEGRDAINIYENANVFVSDAVSGDKADVCALLELLQQGKPIFVNDG